VGHPPAIISEDGTLGSNFAASSSAGNWDWSNDPAYSIALGILKKPNCDKFLKTVARNQAQAISPGADQNVVNDTADQLVNSIPQSLQGASVNAARTENPSGTANGYNKLAVAVPKTNTITLYQGYFNQTFSGQSAQTLIHEGLHLATGASDQDLAKAAGAGTFGKNQTSQASAAFHDKLRTNYTY
jgi:hypothetical protein